MISMNTNGAKGKNLAVEEYRTPEPMEVEVHKGQGEWQTVKKKWA